MAWTNYYRYSFKYTDTYNYDSVSRTIGGLNAVAPSGREDTGANVDAASQNLANTINSFSMGNLSNMRWVSEREMTL